MFMTQNQALGGGGGAGRIRINSADGTAAITGVLNKSVYGNPENATAAAQYIATRLDSQAEEVERGWVGQFVEGQGFLFSKARPNAEIVSLLAAQRGIDGEDAALVA